MRPRPNDPYFYDGEMVRMVGATPGPEAKVRVAALFLKNGELDGRQQWMLVQVARGVAARESIWKRILLDTLLPLSALILLMTVIVWAGTGAGLAPLLRLRREVEGRSPNDLAPLQRRSGPARSAVARARAERPARSRYART
jgi:two-component system sensor histidine kinase TctE